MRIVARSRQSVETVGSRVISRSGARRRRHLEPYVRYESNNFILQVRAGICSRVFVCVIYVETVSAGSYRKAVRSRHPEQYVPYIFALNAFVVCLYVLYMSKLYHFNQCVLCMYVSSRVIYR